MAKPYGPAYEKKRKKQRGLERDVLLYLRSHREAVNWDVVYAHFDPSRTGDIGPVLHLLKEGHYVAVDVKNCVTITKLGLKRLESAMF
jgi:hypothetical protein